jgi:hypothetical protein
MDNNRAFSIFRLFKLIVLFVFICALLGLLMTAGCRKEGGGQETLDEAKAEGKTANDYPEVATDIFQGMDNGTPLTPEEIKGRNTWLLWTGGNEAFWDYMSQRSYGLSDLLKTLDTRRRSARFREMGLVNEPGFRQATKQDQYGLWLDERIETEAEKVDANVYGKSSGVVGLRLFPNPAFDETARRRWDAERYYKDPSYFNDTKLVRPYRVGMSCAFCHVQMHPLHPPDDPENPRWENLSSNIGNQYFKVNQIFGAELKPESFVYQLLDQTPRGTLDTSLIATDGINNPNAMNPLFNVGARLALGTQEKMTGGALRLPPRDETRSVPHILMDGADSIGILGALDRVYVNIGEYHQEWLQHHNLLIGLRKQTPIQITKAQKDSVFWQATEPRIDNLAKFFLKTTGPMHLADAPGGRDFQTKDQNVLNRGKIVFAENCMMCHSGKQPAGYDIGGRFSEEYKRWAREEVLKQDFLDNNYLSIDQRLPVTMIQTNAARALATNATRGHVWDNFSSENYKNSPSVGEIDVYNPFDGSTGKFQMPAGGPGYYRVPTLVSIWATAPFFHNNSLGKYTGDPSVKGRMDAFDDAIEKMLWPLKRDDKRSIWVTQQKSYLHIPAVYLPEAFQATLNYRSRIILVYPWLIPLILCLAGIAWFIRGLRRKPKGLASRIAGVVAVLLAVGLMMFSYFLAGEKGDLILGPIPKGTPVNLLGSINSEAERKDLLNVILKTRSALRKIERDNLDDAAAAELLKKEVAPALLKVSNCPDFVEDRGHYFGTTLSDDDKKALIEFLKTF